MSMNMAEKNYMPTLLGLLSLFSALLWQQIKR